MSSFRACSHLHVEMWITLGECPSLTMEGCHNYILIFGISMCILNMHQNIVYNFIIFFWQFCLQSLSALFNTNECTQAHLFIRVYWSHSKHKFLTLIQTLHIKKLQKKIKTTKLSESLWDHCKNHFMMLLVTIAHHRTCYSILMVLTLPHMPFFLQVAKLQKTTWTNKKILRSRT